MRCEALLRASCTSPMIAGRSAATTVLLLTYAEMISAVSPTRSVLLASSIMSLHQDGHIRGTASQVAATAAHGPRGSPCERFHRSDIYNGAANRIQHHWLCLQEKS